MLDSHKLHRLKNIVILCVLCVGAVILAIADEKEKPPIEIINHKIKQTQKAGSKLKSTSSITYNGRSTLKPETILESRLVLELNNITGQIEISISERLALVADKKFGEMFPLDKILPSAPCFIITAPASQQRNKDIVFTPDQQARLTNKYHFVLGAPAERILFIENEYMTLVRHINTAEKVYHSVEEVANKNREDEKLPENNAAFKKWFNAEREKTSLIVGQIGAFADETQVTYYPLTYDRLRTICNRLVDNFHGIEVTMQYAPKGLDKTPSNDPVSSMIYLSSDILTGIENDAREYLTRETIFNLARFWYDLSEDFARTYDLLKTKDAKMKEWPASQAVWKKGIEEYDRFTTEFTPPVPRLWKEFSPQLEKLRNTVVGGDPATYSGENQIEIYQALLVEGDESQPALQKLDALKTQTKDLFNALWQGLRK